MWFLQNIYFTKMMKPLLEFKVTMKAFDDFKNTQKSFWSNVFWYVIVCIFWKCIQYTIHWDKTQMLKKFLWTKQIVQNKTSFFFWKLQVITVLLSICCSYMNLSTTFVSLKLFVGFSIFNSVSFLLKFIFLFNKMYMDSLSLNVIIPIKSEIIEKSHTVLFPDLWFLSRNITF